MENMKIKGTSLIKYSGDEKHIVIPTEIREIKQGAFKGTNIETIDFSSAINLFVIGEEAFSNCTQLEYAELPVGLKEIGDRAFSGCNKLSYVYIPDTTSTFGKDIFAGLSKVIIVGEDDSRGKKYAESNSNCIFRTDYNNVKQSSRILEKKKSEVKRQEFSIFGVIIECSNTCTIYNDTITHYLELIRKRSLFKTLIKCFPTEIDQDPSGDRYVKALEDTVKETNRRLNRYGILTRDGESGADVAAIHEKLLNVFAAYLNAFIDAMREGTFNATRMSEKLYQEAEDSATGLSYGIIGGFGDLIAYDIDNFLTKNRQLNANLEKARRQTEDVFANMRTKVETSAKEALEDLKPTISEGVNELLNALCHFELAMMEEAGVIDKDLNEDINPNKSRQYCRLISVQPDGLQSAGMALRYDPLNKDVYKKLIEQGSDNDNLYELAVFVGLADYYSSILEEKIRKKIYEGVLRGALVSIEENSNRLPRYTKQSIDQLLADNYSLKIKEVVDGEHDTSETPYNYCVHKLDSIYDKDIHEYLEKESITSRYQIVDWAWDYNEVLNHLVVLRGKEQQKYLEIQAKKQKNYEDAESLMQTRELTALEKSIELFDGIAGYKDSDAQAQKARELLEKEEQYLQTVALVNNAKTKSDFETARAQLQTDENYKNSKALISECQDGIARIHEEEIKAAEEEQLLRRKKAKRLVLVVTIIAFLGGVAVFGYQLFDKMQIYNTAQADLEKENYVEAIEGFSQLDPGYKETMPGYWECMNAALEEYQAVDELPKNSMYEYLVTDSGMESLEMWIRDDGDRDTILQLMGAFEAANKQDTVRLLPYLGTDYIEQHEEDIYNLGMQAFNASHYDQAKEYFDHTQGYELTDHIVSFMDMLDSRLSAVKTSNTKSVVNSLSVSELIAYFDEEPPKTPTEEKWASLSESAKNYEGHYEAYAYITEGKTIPVSESTFKYAEDSFDVQFYLGEDSVAEEVVYAHAYFTENDRDLCAGLSLDDNAFKMTGGFSMIFKESNEATIRFNNITILYKKTNND